MGPSLLSLGVHVLSEGVYVALRGLVKADYTPCLSFRALAAAALPPQSSRRCLCISPFLYEYLAVQGSAS